jgi:PIN domain nuclease of toxin-antitoxin system
MTAIVDTHILLWALSDPDRLSAEHLEFLEDPRNEILVSSVSIAEIAIKESIGKLSVEGDLMDDIEAAGFTFTPFRAEEAVRLRDLPFHHRDPFDRMLIVQALDREVPIVTADEVFGRYSCTLL